MQGTLFRYGPGPAHVAFISSYDGRPTPSPSAAVVQTHVVAVGGLTDGLMFANWIPILTSNLQIKGIGVVQPLLTSSHQGWGMGSLDRDANELLLLAKHLKSAFNCTKIVLIGHSTGCQDAVTVATKYAKAHPEDSGLPSLRGVMLQAPVSDREWLATLPNSKELLLKAEEAERNGMLEDVVFRMMEFDGAALTARRWLSLVRRGGEDDMFSCDLSDEELKEKVVIGLRGIPTLVVISGHDEYVVDSAAYKAFAQRMVNAIGKSARLEIVEKGNHSLSSPSDAESAAAMMTDFVLHAVQG